MILENRCLIITTTQGIRRKKIRDALLVHINREPGNARVWQLSKRKASVRIGKFRVVLRESDPLLSQIRDILTQYQITLQIIRKKSQTPPTPLAEKKAMRLLHQVIAEHDCLELIADKLLQIISQNGRKYILNLEDGSVRPHHSRYGRICIFVSKPYTNEGRLPFGDQLIALALTIAYAPHLIYTL